MCLTILQAGVYDVIDQQILIQAFSKDLVEELGKDWCESTWTEIVWLVGVTTFGDKEDFGREPGRAGTLGWE